jgi:SAM-dependent methyltransferase
VIDNLNDRYFGSGDGQKLLDVGAAGGLTSAALHDIGYQVTALEIDAVLVEQLAADPRNKGVRLVRADATAMPFSCDSFDRVVLLEVLEHIAQTEAVLAEIHRVLRPGGILCVAVPTGYTERLYGRLHPHYAENATHVRIFAKAALSRQLQNSGFVVRSVETKNFVPAVSWLFHALLRSDADHTGKLLQHSFVERVLSPVISAWSRLPLLRTTFLFLSGRVGKSWYFYCAKE